MGGHPLSLARWKLVVTLTFVIRTTFKNSKTTQYWEKLVWNFGQFGWFLDNFWANEMSERTYFVFQQKVFTANKPSYWVGWYIILKPFQPWNFLVWKLVWNFSVLFELRTSKASEQTCYRRISHETLVELQLNDFSKFLSAILRIKTSKFWNNLS